MPFIHIRSLPFEQPKQISKILCLINRDFADRLDIPLEHVHSTWEYFRPGHFAKGEMAPQCQPDSVHSLLVDLLTPDFNDPEICTTMLEVLATALAKHAKVSLQKIFICHQQARSGMVFDGGKVARW